MSAAVAGKAPDVLIVGGGAIGLAIADRLAGEGLGVRLLEADSTGSGASGAAAGMLAPISEAEGDSPLLRLGLESLSEFDALCARLREQTGIDPELERSGLLHVAFSGNELDALERRVRGLEQAATESDWAIRPELEPVDAKALLASGFGLDESVLGGLLSPHEGDYVTRSGFVITPIVVWVGKAEEADPNPDEVDSIHRIPVSEFLRNDAPILNDDAGPEDESGERIPAETQATLGANPVLRMPVGDTWIAAPTAAFLYQFAQVCLLGLETRVAHFDQPRFAWR